MKAIFDCFECITKNVKDLALRLTDDPAQREAIESAVERVLAQDWLDQSPPYLGQQVHRAIRQASGIADPYREAKATYTRTVLEAYPALKQRVLESSNPFRTAAKIALAGNIIDFGVGQPIDLLKTVEQGLQGEPAIDQIGALERLLHQSKTLLYLADNAGETVTDRIFIEQFPSRVETVYAVRGGPVLNDALPEDAVAAGLDRVARILSNGSDAPGTLLEDCSPEFQEAFDRADLIISKGMGNFESLWEHSGKTIAFLLIAKCEYVAAHIGCAVGDALVLMPHGR